MDLFCTFVFLIRKKVQVRIKQKADILLTESKDPADKYH